MQSTGWNRHAQCTYQAEAGRTHAPSADAVAPGPQVEQPIHLGHFALHGDFSICPACRRGG